MGVPEHAATAYQLFCKDYRTKHEGASRRAVEAAWQSELRDGGGIFVRWSGPAAEDKASYVREREMFLHRHHPSVALPQLQAAVHAPSPAPSAQPPLDFDLTLRARKSPRRTATSSASCCFCFGSLVSWHVSR